MAGVVARVHSMRSDTPLRNTPMQRTRWGRAQLPRLRDFQIPGPHGAQLTVVGERRSRAHPIDFDDGVDKGLRSLLRQVVSDAARDRSVHVCAREP